METALANARDQTKLALDTELDRIQRKLDADTAARQSKLDELKDYLHRLDIAHGQFENWFGQLKEIAGSHAADIPPPPAFPTLPADLDLGGINLAPVAEMRDARSKLDNALTVPKIDLNLPALPPAPKIPLVNIPEMPVIDPNLAIPGTLGLTEVDLTGKEIGEFAGFNAFDLQVPGFAVTFLLIGMLMGVSLALIDEHDWGTLERLRSASAPLWATLTGKLLARFVVGFVQMVVLFAAGYVLFGISLGRTPAALMHARRGDRIRGRGLRLDRRRSRAHARRRSAGGRNRDHDDGGDRRMLVADRFRAGLDAAVRARTADHVGDARIQRFDDSQPGGVERDGPGRRQFRLRDNLHCDRRCDRAPPLRLIARTGSSGN